MLAWGFRRLSAALVGLMALFALSGIAGAADYNWKFQSFWQAGTTNQKAFERFAANVGAMSGAGSRSRPSRSGRWCRPGRCSTRSRSRSSTA